MNAGAVSFCVLVPHFNHQDQLREFLPVLLDAQPYEVFIVDDGSGAAGIAAVAEMAAKHERVTLVQLGINRGKGAAVIEGIRAAQSAGFSHVIQIDADGQHCANDIEAMVECSGGAPDLLVSGLPQFSTDIPAARLHGRKLSLWLVRLETLSFSIADAMCGFRIYPCEATLALERRSPLPRRMPFDLEVLVRWLWMGYRVAYVKTDVRYPESGASHFRMVRDNLQIAAMHTKLIVGMLVRSPWLLFRKRPARAESI